MLDGEVELDDAFVGATGNGKHGRGTDQQQVIVAVETGAREAPGRACVRCVPDCSGGSYELFASEHVSIRAQVRADAWNGIRGGLAGWPGLDQGAFEESGPRSLPAAHHVISNFKAFVQGTFHGLAKASLQGAADEFSWRYSHRGSRSACSDLLADCLRGHYRRAELLGALSEQPARPPLRTRGKAGAAHRELVNRLRAGAGIPPWEG